MDDAEASNCQPQILRSLVRPVAASQTQGGRCGAVSLAATRRGVETATGLDSGWLVEIPEGALGNGRVPREPRRCLSKGQSSPLSVGDEVGVCPALSSGLMMSRVVWMSPRTLANSRVTSQSLVDADGDK